MGLKPGSGSPPSERAQARWDGEAAFGRWLLDSARDDAEPDAAATQAAWSRFSSSALRLTADVTHPSAADAGPTAEMRGKVTGAPLAAQTVGAFPARAVWPWLVVGALGGSLITAGWMGRGQSRSVETSHALVAAIETTSPAPREPTAAPTEQHGRRSPDAPALDTVPDERISSAAPKERIRSAAGGPKPLRQRVDHSRAPLRLHGEASREAAPSPGALDDPGTVERSERGSLEREVAALDAASTALSAGRYNYALDLLADYRRDFPQGELARDADVVEIEALFGKGERLLARSRTERFLALYPGDVHAERLRARAAAVQNGEREPDRMPAP